MEAFVVVEAEGTVVFIELAMIGEGETKAIAISDLDTIAGIFVVTQSTRRAKANWLLEGAPSAPVS